MWILNKEKTDLFNADKFDDIYICENSIRGFNKADDSKTTLGVFNSEEEAKKAFLDIYKSSHSIYCGD